MDALQHRLARIDWQAAASSLDARGFAGLGQLLSARECATLVRLYARDAPFRSSVDMASHRFGVGSYRYFASPLPPLVESLRMRLYPPLARIANRWQQQLGGDERFPEQLADFLSRCAGEGQQRRTPLLLRYEAGGYNCLHQDLYGSVAFPLQVVIGLHRPEVDYQGGEFLLVEQRPRAQSRGQAVTLARGTALVFPNSVRPVRGANGFQRVKTRHGVSEVRDGLRMTLGIIFHDAA